MTYFDDLTIATTVHDNQAMSEAMLRSFERNVGQAKEIVLIDDASKASILSPTLNSPIRLQRNEQALGFCKASDLALREVETPFALLVDADVLFEPGDFAGGYEVFKGSPWAWVNFRQIGFDSTPQSSSEERIAPPYIFAAGNKVCWGLEKSSPLKANQGSQGRIIEVEAAHSSSTLVNMAAFRAIGGFDPWYWQCESDIDLSVRFRKNNYRVGVDTGYCVKHEGAGGKGGGDSRVLDLYRARLHFYECHYPSSRFYLRPMLFLRHLLESAYCLGDSLLARNKSSGLALRGKMLRTVFDAYY